MGEDLVLDTAIRDWVLIPLSVVMVLIGVLRYFVSKLMRSQQPPDVKLVREGQLVLRARYLRSGANFIPAKSFLSRKAYFTNEAWLLAGKWPSSCPKRAGPKSAGTDVIRPKHGYGHDEKELVNDHTTDAYFCVGELFLLRLCGRVIISYTLFPAKLPFPLTPRFRSMLQNGIDLSTVDVSYVSSRSWYFLNLFGLRGLFSLILGEENATDDTQRMMMQMGGFGHDSSKNLGAEKDSLDIIQHEWSLPKFEERAATVLRELIA